MTQLAGKVALVTGASKGIGAAIAVNYSGSRAGAEAVAARITGRGGRAFVVQGDVAGTDDVRRILAETTEALGRA